MGGGGGAAGGAGADAGGVPGAVNNLVYSPGPWFGEGAGGDPGMVGVANTLDPMLAGGACGAGGGDILGACGAAGVPPGLLGVPNRRVKAPGSSWDGGGGATGGRFRSSPPGRDSGRGDWKKRVNSPESDGPATDGEVTGGVAGAMGLAGGGAGYPGGVAPG